MKILLIDLSSLFRPIWEMAGKEADVDYASKATVARVHSLAAGYDHVAVCCDSRKSWRKELAPTYKSQRPPTEEPMRHQLRIVQEQLAADGFPVWEVEGFEADDVIASAVKWVLSPGNVDRSSTDEIVIASNDKDMMQLVQPNDDLCGSVCVKSLRSDAVYDSDGVLDKFGVFPHQMRDLLSMWGDASDGVKGIEGIGQKKGAELLKKHGSLANLYATLGNSCSVLDLTPNMFSKLKEGEQAAALAWKLVGLREDVELPFADIFKPRAPRDAEAQFKTEDEDMAEVVDEVTGEITQKEEPATEPRVEQIKSKPEELEVEKDTALVVAPHEWSKGLEPRSYRDATLAAKHMFESRLFSAFGSPQAVLAVILAGREMGLGVMQSLRGFHIVEGKPVLSSGLMAALVLNSGKAKQFRCIHTSATKATFRAQRIGDDEPIDVSFTIEEAKSAGLIRPRSGWEKYPADMLVARATARAARLVFPDVCAGLYLAEELGREDLEAA